MVFSKNAAAASNTEVNKTKITKQSLLLARDQCH
jgi:hypothetical protein